MPDVNDLYRRLFLAQTFALRRDLPEVAEAFHRLGEALVTAAPDGRAAITDLVEGLTATADAGEPALASSEDASPRRHLRVVP